MLFFKQTLDRSRISLLAKVPRVGLRWRSNLPIASINSIGKHKTQVVLRKLPSAHPNYLNWALIGASFISAWTLAYYFMANSLNMNSGQVQGVMSALRNDSDITDRLGQQIGFKNNFTYISGTFHIRNGIINISFPIKGSKQAALVRFHAVRLNDQSKHWFVKNLEVELNDGTVFNMTEKARSALLATD